MGSGSFAVSVITMIEMLSFPALSLEAEKGIRILLVHEM
ncbi:hypothetical protein OP10G_1370 [Fimbriimonas ginsengisoli Gsoil 348]|uniref:Uncharacterized protein n=1 Tax=Fimbriimonas ginsengisoli Gsoil 348 TaxID=661478 RepID=A0A068NMD9_FIMGI|nr:hypothetical protein OP10G_1370 [Fimbriimonas ginsengisoli Gsoil 348]